MNLNESTAEKQPIRYKPSPVRSKQSRSSNFCGCEECNHDHCSEFCRQLWYTEKIRRNNQQKQINKVLFIDLRYCAIRNCQKLFIPKTSNQKYCCSKCSSMAFRMRYKKDWYLMKDVWIIGNKKPDIDDNRAVYL